MSHALVDVLALFYSQGMEEWKAVPGYEGYYEVSDLGRFRSVPREVASKNGSVAKKRGRIMAPYRSKKTGYYQARLAKEGVSKTLLLHRLICEAFHGPPPANKPQVAHADGARDNNRADNLRWASAKENAEDRIAHGTAPQGTRCSHTLTESDVRTIRREYKSLYGQRVELANRFGVTTTQIHNVVTRKHWTHI